MKVKRQIFIFVIILFLITLMLIKINISTNRENNQKSINVLLVYFSLNLDKKGISVLNAYKSVLKEEGIPFKIIDVVELLNKNPKEIIKFVPAVILPDRITTSMPEDVKYWFADYVKSGGNIFVVYDAGVKDINNLYREKPLFTHITGVNYCLYKKFRDRAYSLGKFRFKREILKNLDIPPGKTINNFLSGYKYGILTYPVALNKIEAENINVLATVVVGNKQYVGVALRDFGKGHSFYVNLPLGFLKANSDDLPLRAMLRFFLHEVAVVPYIVNVPDNKGGLVINWHIDSSLDWKSIPMMIKKGYYSKHLTYSSHVTAGDFLEKPGDGLGFDACGKGKKYLKMLKPYGITGSHGGWAHNWFARKLKNGEFTREEIKRYIKINNECLEKVLNYKIVEYSAPIGVFPQPVSAQILEELGMVAYYYTGDSGSFPNKTFFNGKKVSDKLYAFPVMVNGKNASFYEMWKSGMKEEDVQKWLYSVVDFVVNRRTIRLIYSHPYDIPLYPKAIRNFIRYAEKKVIEKELYVIPMYAFYSYLNRFSKTVFAFVYRGDRLEILLENREGLNNIPIAIPKNLCRLKSYDMEDKHYYYFIIKESIKKFKLVCNRW